MIWFACRHHMYELIIKSVWELLMGTDMKPFYLKFKNFQTIWPNLKKENYDILEITDPQMVILKEDVVQFCLALLNSKTKQPRDDYREFIQLVLIILGEYPGKPVFKKPGAFHKVSTTDTLILRIFSCYRKSHNRKSHNRKSR